VCRGSAGVCDVQETCTGAAAACPGDSFLSAATVCRAAVAGGCDVAENCTGAAAACPADAVVAAGTTCRASAGACDPAETCNGSNSCPADTLSANGTVCRGSAGVCDVQETCTGASAACPGDSFLSAATVCRAAVAGGCDVAENCTGAAAACPADVVKVAGTVCRASAGACDPQETCTGASNACPADTLTAAGTVCRGSAGVCDVQETCTGSAAACPGDSFLSAATVCRAAVAGGCDVAENCTGSSASCPGDSVVAAGTVCRASTGPCDPAETCNGSNSCPGNSFTAAGTVCRGSAGVCDVAETCTGSSGACPGDSFVGAGTVCRAAVAGGCDVAEACTGGSASCPGDSVVAAGTVCRASTGPCDPAETCNGSNSCPGNSFTAAGTVCRGSAGVCDVQETCTGSSGACPGDSFVGAGTVCRGSAGPCDVQETCTGGSAACPGDSFVGAGTVCRGSAGVCDPAETCTGGSAACPGDSKFGGGTVCRAASGVCDVQEVCDGVNNGCPGDTKVANGTACSDCSACTIADTCQNGACTGAFVTDGTDSHPATCSTGLPGRCSAGHTYCVSAASGIGCSQDNGPIGEQCGNGIDDDCNGQVDENCCGNGVCEGGVGENCSSCPNDCGFCGCPFVYSEASEGFAYETSVGGASLIGTADTEAKGSKMQFAPMWARLDRAQIKGGAVSTKLLIAQDEIAYVDEAHLTVVEHPAGYEVLSSSSMIFWPGLGSVDPQEFYALRTAALRAPVSATWLGKADVNEALSSLDDKAALQELAVDNYYDLDFGAVQSARNARLVIEGWKVQTTRNLPAGIAQRGPRLEVQQRDGSYQTALELAYPRGDRKAVSFDLSSVKWPTGKYQVRLYTGTSEGGTALWSMDRVRLTEEASVSVNEMEILPTQAKLSFAGAPELLATSLDRPNLNLPNGRGTLAEASLTFGKFTRYGDVKGLLGGVDDMLVVMRKGDVVDLSFERIPAAAVGQVQTLFLRTELLFKPTVCPGCTGATELSKNVGQLPFHGMSRYPYASDEHFPSDAAHKRYLEEFATRVYKTGDTRWGL
jgi:hypothetical protein